MRKFVYAISSLALALSLVMTLGVPVFACNGSRWTGGGSVFTADGMRVTHGFEIYAVTSGEDNIPTAGPNNLEVNWGGNHFHLLDLTWVSSYYTPSLGGPQPPPKSVDNVLIGKGTGRYNGVDGAYIEFTFTDQGEPGNNDTAQMEIWDADGNVVLNVGYATPLQFGNHQSHLLTGNK